MIKSEIICFIYFYFESCVVVQYWLTELVYCCCLLYDDAKVEKNNPVEIKLIGTFDSYSNINMYFKALFILFFWLRDVKANSGFTCPWYELDL